MMSQILRHDVTDVHRYDCQGGIWQGFKVDAPGNKDFAHEIFFYEIG